MRVITLEEHYLTARPLPGRTGLLAAAGDGRGPRRAAVPAPHLRAAGSLPRLLFRAGAAGGQRARDRERADRKLGAVCGHLDRSVAEYFLTQFWITTSGFVSVPPLQCALAVVGVDRVLFSVDYPFDDMRRSREFLDAAPLAPADREKIAHGNAERLLGL